MSENILCALAGYDDESEAYLAGLQQSLYDAGFRGNQTKGLIMHITMGTFKPEQEAELRGLVEKAADRPTFDVSVSHLGMFAGSRVLFAAPDLNGELAALRECFGPVPGWVPHTTLLMDEPERIYKAVPVAAAGFRPLRAKITSLSLYEFWPKRLIVRHELK